VTYTKTDRAHTIYNAIVDVFDYNSTSECVTPLGLALHHTPDISPSQKVVVPAAGIGTYVLAAMLKGASPENITAVEISPSYHRLGSGIFSRFGVNYVLADFLEWSPGMEKFEVAIGNPPYQRGRNSDFYIQFMKKVNDILLDEAEWSLLSPTKGSMPSSKAQKHLKELGWSRLELGAESWFPGQQQTISIYSGEKGSEPGSLKVICGDHVGNYDFGSVFPVNAASETAISILNKFFSYDKKIPFNRTKEEPKTDYLFVSRMVKRYSPHKPKGGPLGLKVFVNQCGETKDGAFVECPKDQALEYQALLTDSPIYRYISANCLRAAFVPPLFWKQTPDFRGDTDEKIFKKLKLTSKETQAIMSWAEVN
jgi:hypothetical protein